jgi:uncharacterized membrane protein
MKELRSLFIRGLLSILPFVITLYILFWFFTFLDGLIGKFVIPILGFSFPGIGLIFTIGLILLTGFIVSNYVGVTLLKKGEELLQRIPLISKIYSSVKQIVEAFSVKDKQIFSNVVLVEYPRRGTYAIGFVTGECKGEAQDKTAARLINVFIPTTPNPTSGMLILVPDKEIIYLDMTVEEGLKLIISAGAVVPEYDKKDEET